MLYFHAVADLQFFFFLSGLMLCRYRYQLIIVSTLKTTVASLPAFAWYCCFAQNEFENLSIKAIPETGKICFRQWLWCRLYYNENTIVGFYSKSMENWAQKRLLDRRLHYLYKSRAVCKVHSALCIHKLFLLFLFPFHPSTCPPLPDNLISLLINYN